MRAIGVVVLGVIVSYLIAMAAIGLAALMGLILQPGPHQEFEFIAVFLAEAIVAVGSAVVFAIVLVAGGARTAVRRTAIVLAVLFVAVLSAPEIFGLATQDTADVIARDQLVQIAIFVTVMGVPGLLTIFIQWWIVGRYLFKPVERGDT